MSDFDYDLFVIGGGSGGVRAARIAAQHGARVAIAEEYRFGGTCVIRGCVPKKLLVYASQYAEHFEDAVGFGWTTKKVDFDWPTLIAAKDKEIDRLEGIYAKNLEAAGVELYHCRAELRDRHSVRLVGQDKHVTAKYILVATGGQPNLDQDLEGIEHVITSNEALHLEQLPERIVVAGGGYIAVEFACIFNGLGVDTTLLYRGPKILRGFDEDVRDHLTAEMKKKGVDIVCDAVFSKIEKKDATLHGTLSNGDVVEVDQIMFAIGRNAYTGGLGLENAGVELRSNGSIKVDEYSRTNIDNIYAVGDVTDRVALTPVAIREGHAFADTVFGGKDIKVDHELIATAVFSQPEIGTVGLTEQQARDKYKEVDIYKSVFRPMRHTLSGRDEKMLMKLIVAASTDRVVGCHIMGPDAGEMAQLLGISLKMGATKADFDATMAVHPTAAEELVTMRTKWEG
jgi:glutathione reductase (NADPH)